MEILNITVLKEDFETSEYVEPNDCVIARAIKREFPNHYVGVDSYTITIDSTHIRTPKKLEDMVCRMYKFLGKYEDKRSTYKPLEPIDFEFTIKINI